MPDINGKLQFQDYKNELKLRGFDAYSDTALGTYINFGYRYIAGSFPFSWQEASISFCFAGEDACSQKKSLITPSVISHVNSRGAV